MPDGATLGAILNATVVADRIFAALPKPKVPEADSSVDWAMCRRKSDKELIDNILVEAAPSP